MTTLQEKAEILRTEAILAREQGDYQGSLKKLLMSVSFESNPLTHIEKARTLLKIWQTQNYAETLGIIEDLSRVREIDTAGQFESEVLAVLDVLKNSIEERIKVISKENAESYLSQLDLSVESGYARVKIPQDSLASARYDAKRAADLCEKKMGNPELEKGLKQLELVLDGLLDNLIQHQRYDS